MYSAMQCSFLLREDPDLALVIILSAYLNPLLLGRKMGKTENFSLFSKTPVL
jgi:hypothetical protein